MDSVKEKTTMQDTLHTCLRCGNRAHECEKNTYRCDDSECGFVWRVERVGD